MNIIKRGLLVLLVFLLLINIAFAEINVVLSEPNIDENRATLSCTGTSSNSSLTSVKLYTNITGEWVIEQTKDDISGNNVYINFIVEDIAKGDYEWNCEFHDNKSNSSFANENGEFTILNRPPEFSGTLPDVSLKIDSTKEDVFNLNDYFSDPDDDTLIYSVTGNSSITVTIGSDNYVSFSSTDDWEGTETMVFTASDGEDEVSSNEIDVTVENDFGPPILIEDIPQINITKNSSKNIYLDEYFEDENDLTLSYSFTGSNINITFDDDVATITPKINWTGETSVRIIANNSYDVVESNSFIVKVTETEDDNLPPRITDYYPKLTNVFINTGEITTFEIEKEDPDEDDLEITWYVNGQKQSETSRQFDFSSVPGDYEIKVIVSDGQLTATHTWNLNIEHEEVETQDVERFQIEEPERVPFCGDGIVDPGETCSTCPEDVPCAKDEVCINHECVKKRNTWKTMLIILIILFMLGSGGYLFYKSNITQDTGHDDKPEKKRRIELSGNIDEPASEVDDFYDKWTTSELKVPTPESSSEDLKTYIKKMKKMGKTNLEIKNSLKKKGWEDWQIGLVLKSIK